MPFTKDGITPDIIINPNGLPRRMSIAQLIETVYGKIGSIVGCDLDATPFRKVTIEDAGDILANLGFSGTGKEVLYNGKTGAQMASNIFIGPTFYYRLKHLVNDKIHSRSTGPYSLISLQPSEGRSRDGGLRFGEMERDCTWYHSPIPHYCGLSREIGTLENSHGFVMSYSEEKNGVIPSKQTNFLNKGMRECVELTFQDGRKLVCTPEHKLLTSDNQWVKANEIPINDSRIKTGINYPLMKLKEEMEECNGWQKTFGYIHLKTDSEEEFMKSLAFARLLGYITMDGTISFHKLNQTCNCNISLGHELDCRAIVEDLNLFTKSNCRFEKSRNYYCIKTMSKFADVLSTIKGVITGRKVIQPSTLPEFILEEDCPKPIIREFLAGMFGADGHTCHLGMHRGKRDLLSSVSFSKTRVTSQRDSLSKMMEQIKMLFAKFGINNITTQSFKETSYSKKNFGNVKEKAYQLTIHLDIDELIPFSEKIGFRYCCHKTQRLEAAVSYKRLRNEVVRQHNWLVARADELSGFSKSKKENPSKIVKTKSAIEQATKELQESEGIIHPYAIPSQHDMTDHLVKGTQFGNFRSNAFPTAEEFLAEIGALDWFLNEKEKLAEEYEPSIEVDDSFSSEVEEQLTDSDDLMNTAYGVYRKTEVLPVMNLKLVSKRNVGPKEVFDIEVENTHTFLANGIVAHNCMLSHGAVQFLKERMFDCSDKYYVWIDKETGMISPVNPDKNIYKSLYSDNTTRFAKIQIPYSSKLLIQELQSMHINPRIFTK